ncbi:MAG: hypothetical protein ACJ798_12060 [Phenylobacterium sp.]
MGRQLSLTVALAAMIGVAAPASLARPPHASHVARNAYGQPDLEGLWANGSLTKLQRRAGAPLTFATRAEEDAYEAAAAKRWAAQGAEGVGQGASEWLPTYRMARIDGKLRTSFIVDPPDGRVPYRPEALKHYQQVDDGENFDGPETRDPTERCLTAGSGSAGPPILTSPAAGFKQIVQTRNEVAILSELNHDVRIVRLGSKHLPASVRPWMGDSIGWWDGATLVVETTNFHPQEGYRLWFMMSPQARVTERFTRVSKTELRYSFEVDDPASYTQAWRAEMPFLADKGPIYEYACHEGNYGLPNILAGARREEEVARAKAQAATAAR